MALALAGAGVVVFVRATQGGGPIYYFMAAVLLGMGFAAFQGGAGRGGGGPRGAGPGGRSKQANRSKGGGGR